MQNKIQLNSYSGAEVLHIINLKYLKANLFFYNTKRCQRTIFVYVDNVFTCVCVYMCIYAYSSTYTHILLEYISQHKQLISE